MQSLLKLIQVSFLISLYNRSVAQLDHVGKKRLVLIYDEEFDFSSANLHSQNPHEIPILESVASSRGLSMDYHQLSYTDIFLQEFWSSSSIAGIISIGNCGWSTSVISMAEKSNIPILVLDHEFCERDINTSFALPLYKAKMFRRYQCVGHVMHHWLSDGSRSPTFSFSLKEKMSLERSKLHDEFDYTQEYLNCLGSDILIDVEDIDPNTATFDMRLDLGKRYLNGRALKIVTINRPPFVKLTMSGDEIVSAEGFCFEMLNVMANRFNFTYSLVLPYDGNWGAPMENGTFNGMVGMVHRDEVDMAIAGFTITYIRATVIAFTHAFYEEPTTILIPPPTEEHDFLAFLNPLSWQVWLATLVAILIVGTLMWFLASVGDLPYLYPHNYRRVSYNWLRYVWDCAFSLSAQGNRMKQTQPVRILNGVWWTFSVILIYTYTGTLIAFLTVPKVSSLIESLEELANQREVLWTYRAKTAHDSLFSSAPSPGTYHKIGQLLKERPDLLVKTDIEGINAVLRGNMAFIKEKSWLDFAMERDFLATRECRLFQVNQIFFSAGFGWVLQQDSAYLSLVNSEILKMMQSGLFTIWRQKYWPKPNKCTASKGTGTTGPRALRLENFLGHFFLLGVGVCISLVVLAIENVWLRIVTPKEIGKDDSLIAENEITSTNSIPRTQKMSVEFAEVVKGIFVMRRNL